MTVFDLLFICAFLASVACVITILALAIGGKRARLLRAFEICAVAYFAIGLTVSLFKPQRIMNFGEAWCFDDWCLEVQNVSKMPQPPSIAYHIQLRIFSRAARVAQRANGAWLFLIDDRGNRYAPEPDPAAAPLDIRLEPGASITTTRVFRVPANAQHLGLITGHGGPYCGPMNILIIGASGCVFNKFQVTRSDPT